MLVDLLAFALLAALAAWLLTGGADFGGGVWDLLARGPRAARQRSLIERSIAPIWEANHVWLILAVVLLFVCFPQGYASVSTALHVPLTGALFGIVFRGSAFVFRHYGLEDAVGKRRWSVVFAVASVITPFLLGLCVGALASGQIQLRGPYLLPESFTVGWTSPFAVAIGGLTLALCALLAACYLCVDAEGDETLQADFRRRALGAAVITGGFAALALLLARSGAPGLAGRLLGGPAALALHSITGVAAVAVFVALVRRRFRVARVAVVVQATGVLSGWAIAQHPFLLPPDLTFAAAAAPDGVLLATGIALLVGGLFLLPALAWLFRVFGGLRHP